MGKLSTEHWIGLTANSLLFLSSLLLLIDIAPRDFLPSHRQTVNAVQMLREHRNVLGALPDGLHVQPETSGMSIASDDATFQILRTFIREQASLARRVDWRRVVGVGYAAVRVPVGASVLDAIHPLYLVSLPQANEIQMQLQPVGQLEELDEWLAIRRQGSLTFWALALLTFGFLLQLVPSLRQVWINWRYAGRVTTG